MKTLLFIALALSACTHTTPHATPASTTQSIPESLAAADRAAYAAFPDALGARAKRFIPASDDGLLGRNARWGDLYSPRFQMGAGHALRLAVAAGRSDYAQGAFRAIEIAIQNIRDDGYVTSRVPGDLGVSLSAANIASGAAFFLGDACLGMLALSTQPDASITPKRQRVVRDALVRANRWLLTQDAALLSVDRLAPNRLLFNARAYQACAQLDSDTSLREASQKLADRFALLALTSLSEDGHFVEAAGHDTSYQGVALMVGQELLLAGYSNPALPRALKRATTWMLGRIGPEGRVDSTGNARTCTGGETFGGKQKGLDFSALFTGVAYTSVQTKDARAARAAASLERWVKDNPGVDPCGSTL